MLNVRIPDDLRDLIDAARGDVPRERWIRRVLEAALSSSETPEPPAFDCERDGHRYHYGNPNCLTCGKPYVPDFGSDAHLLATPAQKQRVARMVNARQQALNDDKAKKR